MLSSWIVLTLTAATPAVTGNGFGFAVYGDAAGGLSKLYAHPYSFARPDPNDPLGEGIATTSFITRLAWQENTAGRADYLDESHIVVVDGAASRQTFFMPFGLDRHAVIVGWEGKQASATPPALCPTWALPLAERRAQRVGGVEATLFRFEGVRERLVAVPLDRAGRGAGGPCRAGVATWAFASLESDGELESAVHAIVAWAAGHTGTALVARELEELETWRVKPAVTFASDTERRLWRQSEVVLRMAQSREPNRPGRFNHGLVLAVLPDAAWANYWVRDMTYGVHALIAMGHKTEARAALLAYFHAQAVGVMQREAGGLPYQVSVVRYFGDGSEQPFFTQEGSTNVELDGWGLVLWVLGEYVQRFQDTSILSALTYRGTVYESAVRFIGDPLLANLEPYQRGLIVTADTSIWEEREKDKKHFAFSTATTIVGLRALRDLAIRENDRALQSRLEGVLARLEVGFAKAYVPDGRLHGTLESGIKNDIDGAVLSAINFGIVTDRQAMQRTVDAMQRLEVASGGYRRVTCVITDPSIFEYWYERQEFLFIDMSLAEVHLRLGQTAKAAALMSTIVDKAARDRFLIPEMYVSVDNPLFKGAIGDPTGAMPIVGYGSGAYIAYLLQRERLTSAAPSE